MTVPLIPRKLLFGNPTRVSPSISPDGGRLAYLAPDEGVLNVWVRTVGKDDDKAVTSDRHRGIRAFGWAENGEHILYVQDKGGDENWHLYRVPSGGGDEMDLTPIDGVQARIVAHDRDHPDDLLVGLNDRNPALHDVYRMNIRTGERQLVLKNDIGAVGFTPDHDLAFRGAHVPTPDGGFQILLRDDDEGDWREFLSVKSEDALGTGLHGLSRDGKTLFYETSVGVNTSELRAYELSTGETTLLARDPDVDVGPIVFDPDTLRPQAVVYEKDRQEYQILDKSIAQDVSRLSEAHHGDMGIVGRDRSDRHWLVVYVQDRGPVVYYSYDRETKEVAFLFSARPELADAPLAEMRPVSFRARDGLTIHGYLTLPLEVEPRGLPAVVDVHGGPWHRNSWGYDPEAQWFANRGYACLQLNFRGSTGYGKAFLNAGDREWGGKMQDDVTDGARWLVEQGFADPKRIGIYGGSYGGYAVLSALTTTPDLFACGVDIVGPSNLITFSRSIPPYWEPLRAMFARRVGDVESEEEFLRSRSPLFHVDRIEAPLLIVQGKNDPRVKREESLQIVKALEDRGKTVEYIEFPDEGHGFARPENRLKHYAASEAFLAEHLGGRAEGDAE